MSFWSSLSVLLWRHPLLAISTCSRRGFAYCKGRPRAGPRQACIASGEYDHSSRISLFYLHFLIAKSLCPGASCSYLYSRKKSDAKRSDVSAAGIGVALSTPQPFPYPIVTQEVQVYPPPLLPALPPISDFRTSLILPEYVIKTNNSRPPSADMNLRVLGYAV